MLNGACPCSCNGGHAVSRWSRLVSTQPLMISRQPEIAKTLLKALKRTQLKPKRGSSEEKAAWAQACLLTRLGLERNLHPLRIQFNHWGAGERGLSFLPTMETAHPGCVSLPRPLPNFRTLGLLQLLSSTSLPLLSMPPLNCPKQAV